MLHDRSRHAEADEVSIPDYATIRARLLGRTDKAQIEHERQVDAARELSLKQQRDKAESERWRRLAAQEKLALRMRIPEIDPDIVPEPKPSKWSLRRAKDPEWPVRAWGKMTPDQRRMAREVAKKHGLQWPQIFCRTNSIDVTWARFELYYVVRSLCDGMTDFEGAHLFECDRTTFLHGIIKHCIFNDLELPALQSSRHRGCFRAPGGKRIPQKYNRMMIRHARTKLQPTHHTD